MAFLYVLIFKQVTLIKHCKIHLNLFSIISMVKIFKLLNTIKIVFKFVEFNNLTMTLNYILFVEIVSINSKGNKLKSYL